MFSSLGVTGAGGGMGEQPEQIFFTQQFAGGIARLAQTVGVEQHGGTRRQGRGGLRVFRLRLDAEGRVMMTSEVTRDQRRNLEDAREKLRALVLRALERVKPRRVTKPSRGAVALQIAFLGLLFTLMGFTSDGLYALVAGTAGQWLRRNAQYPRWQRFITGGVFIGLGVTAAIAGNGRK